MPKILFIDIPGVVNDARNEYSQGSFDPKKVALVKDIIKATGCQVVFAPRIPDGKDMKGHVIREVSGICSLLSALFPDVSFSMIESVEEAVQMISRCQGGVSCAVVRHNDVYGLQWQLTFPTRYISTTGWKEVMKGSEYTEDNGLTEQKAQCIIAMLNTPMSADEYPLTVITQDIVTAVARNRIAKIRGDGEVFQGDINRFLEEEEKKWLEKFKGTRGELTADDGK